MQAGICGTRGGATEKMRVQEWYRRERRTDGMQQQGLDGHRACREAKSKWTGIAKNYAQAGAPLFVGQDKLVDMKQASHITLPWKSSGTVHTHTHKQSSAGHQLQADSHAARRVACFVRVQRNKRGLVVRVNSCSRRLGCLSA